MDAHPPGHLVSAQEYAVVVVGTGDGQSEKRVIVSMARHLSWRQVLQTVAVDVTDLQCASVCAPRDTLSLLNDVSTSLSVV